MDAIQRKCLACGEPFTAVSRRQKYCSQKCRPSTQNAFYGPLHRGAENQDLSCLQPIENIDAGLGDFQEFQTCLPQANSSKELQFEKWPPKTGKKAACITYKLSDGQQINTGYGRASRALGYVMEVWPGKWVARVRDLASLPSSLTAAKQAAIDLYRSRKSGEPEDWNLNQTAANEIDRAEIARQRRTWPVDLMGGHRQSDKRPALTVELPHAILDSERVLKNDEPIRHPDDEPVLEYYDDGFPKLPDCLDRRPKPLLEKAA
jgi:hypothetical protein